MRRLILSVADKRKWSGQLNEPVFENRPSFVLSLKRSKISLARAARDYFADFLLLPSKQ